MRVGVRVRVFRVRVIRVRVIRGGVRGGLGLIG